MDSKITIFLGLIPDNSEPLYLRNVYPEKNRGEVSSEKG